MGLNIPEGVRFEDWVGMAPVFRALSDHLRWCIGDWLNYGEWEYGQRYSQAMEATGFEVGYLTNLAWVARQVPISFRNEKLPVSYHMLVAGKEFDADDRKALLDRAILGEQDGAPVLMKSAAFKALVKEYRAQKGLPEPEKRKSPEWSGGEYGAGTDVNAPATPEPGESDPEEAIAPAADDESEQVNLAADSPEEATAEGSGSFDISDEEFAAALGEAADDTEATGSPELPNASLTVTLTKVGMERVELCRAALLEKANEEWSVEDVIEVAIENLCVRLGLPVSAEDDDTEEETEGSDGEGEE